MEKPKRGTPFFNKATKEKVWLNRVIDKTTYLVCNDEGQGLNSDFYRAEVINLQPLSKKIPKPLNRIKPATSKSLTQLAKDIKNKELKNIRNIWYADQVPAIPANCENCSKPLNAYTSFDKRGVTAHILPKNEKEFPSVATHPQNRMFLGFKTCICHNKWDKASAEERSKMPCYAIAIPRFRSFEDQLTGKEHVKAYQYLNL